MKKRKNRPLAICPGTVPSYCLKITEAAAVVEERLLEARVKEPSYQVFLMNLMQHEIKKHKITIRSTSVHSLSDIFIVFPGRNGMVYEEEGWVDEEATGH